MKRLIIMCIFVFLNYFGFSQQYDHYTLQPYVDFLKTQNQSPIDYILRLFDRYDVVIIGERNHPEATQYNFIRELILSPEFTGKVGHIMTEVGSNNYTDAVNQVLHTNYSTDSQFEKELIQVLRDCETQVLWPRTTFWELLKLIYQNNRMRPLSHALDITFLNPAWKWSSPNATTSNEFETMYASTDRQNYDVIMAENAINALYRFFESPRKKTLIILNVPHHLKACEYWPHTTTSCIMARFPGRVATVKLNNFITRSDSTGIELLPVANGRWDAAFAAMDNRPVGFDLQDSPFGRDGFDGYDQRPKIREKITYQDMFDGYIFYNPVEKMYNMSGIPGLVDAPFIPELLRRYELRGITGPEIMKSTDGNIEKWFNEPKQSSIWDNDSERIKFDSIVQQNLK